MKLCSLAGVQSRQDLLGLLTGETTKLQGTGRKTIFHTDNEAKAVNFQLSVRSGAETRSVFLILSHQSFHSSFSVFQNSIVMACVLVAAYKSRAALLL